MASTELARRNTRQKAAIRSAFQAIARPLSPQQVLEIAQSAVPDLGIATVYRNINALVEEGWLSGVELVGGVCVYEMAGKKHHHHFQCDRCHQVFDVPGCVPAVQKLAGPKFRVRSHEIFLYGTCAECNRRA